MSHHGTVLANLKEAAMLVIYATEFFDALHHGLAQATPAVASDWKANHSSRMPEHAANGASISFRPGRVRLLVVCDSQVFVRAKFLLQRSRDTQRPWSCSTLLAFLIKHHLTLLTAKTSTGHYVAASFARLSLCDATSRRSAAAQALGFGSCSDAERFRGQSIAFAKVLSRPDGRVNEALALQRNL